MKNIIFFIIINLFLISCQNNEWNSDIKKQFLDSCVEEAILYAEQSASYSYCDCCLVELQKIYDEETFSKEEVKMTMGLPTSIKFNDDMANVVLKCVERLSE